MLWELSRVFISVTYKEYKMSPDRETRVKLDMNTQDLLIAMGDGNPGALTACVELLKHGAHIDPDSALGGFNPLLHLDFLGIYEERIYMLWNDVCDRDIGKMIAVLRANQLGGLAGVIKETIDHAIDNRGEGIDLDAVLVAVKERLPNFNQDVVA